MSSTWLIILILGVPVLGGLLTFFLGAKNATKTYFIGPVSTFLLSIWLLIQAFETSLMVRWNWLPNMEIGWSLDAMSGVLIALVAFISLLVHLFSAHYMTYDGGIHRYYAKLGFFTASMIGLLAADHLLLVFIFWELVGFSSYLLIGFWFQDASKSKAAKEAFMINRVADVGLLIGVILLIGELGQPFISELSGGDTSMTMQVAGFCLMIGALGKSAQFPFFGWLPKAMAGPTPVSALIHAATMVAAGVYLLVRVVPILTPQVLTSIAILGAITTFMAAIAALTQFDIKKVLAYSTVSQLGYMIMGIGVGAYQSSLFHLWTHAFFKAGLFLGAGTVIHYFHALKKDDAHFDSQDMRNMGDLRRQLPITFYAFLICGLALSGLPFFSGFLSKEGILTEAAIWASEGNVVLMIVPILGLLTAVLTPYYIGRQLLLVFFGQSRTKLKVIKGMEPALKVVIPLTALAVASIWFFHSASPLDAHGWWLSSLVFDELSVHNSGLIGIGVMVFSIVSVLSGLYYAYHKFGVLNDPDWIKSPSTAFSKLSWNSWYLEHSYDRVANGYLYICRMFYAMDKKIIDKSVNSLGVGTVVLSKVFAIIDREVIDGVVNFAAWLSKRIGELLTQTQSGKVQNQLIWLVLMVLLLVVWLQF